MNYFTALLIAAAVGVGYFVLGPVIGERFTALPTEARVMSVSPIMRDGAQVGQKVVLHIPIE